MKLMVVLVALTLSFSANASLDREKPKAPKVENTAPDKNERIKKKKRGECAEFWIKQGNKKKLIKYCPKTATKLQSA